MTRCYLDHLTVTAPTLEVGAKWVYETLGVMPEVGGKHPRMGTHNLLLRLGDALFLEVIAPDPQAQAPTRPRWFALDRLHHDSAPTLRTWVARTSDIQASTLACSETLGQIEPMSRGELHWWITLPPDGSLMLNGIAPALIAWQTLTHPAEKLQDRGLSLNKLELFHPEPERISRLLRSLGMDNSPIAVRPTCGEQSTGLVAVINTPQGLRSLST